MGNGNAILCKICWKYPLMKRLLNGKVRYACGTSDVTDHYLAACEGRGQEEALANWNRIWTKRRPEPMWRNGINTGEKRWRRRSCANTR